MLLRPAVVVVRRVVVALVLSVFVGVTALAQTTPAWAVQYDVTATITVGSGPRGVAVSPDGTKAYVANWAIGTVSVINTTTNAVDATITVGSNPSGVASSPDGTKVYVTNYNDGTVSVINTTTNAVDATITVGSEPYGVAVSPDGTKAYVVNRLSNNVSVIDLRAPAS
ncbi:beta-propeller fold lactonase family protein, partial [Pontimonas sp.]|nr:beta-propeller fold lactonase family protein [Pontimonas sp.]